MTSFKPDPLVSRLPSLVLLVEDNPIIAMNTEALLLDIGVEEVKAAASVAEALDLLAARQFDFAILDLKLGEDEDSLPVAERLSSAGVPVVFATGFGEDFDLPERFITMPILKKPYSFDDLQSIIRSQ